MNTKEKKNRPRNIFQSIFRHTALHAWLHLSHIFRLRYTALSFAAAFVTFKVAALLPRRTSDQHWPPGQLGQLPGTNAGGLCGGTPREVPSVPRDQPTPAAALLFKWIYMTCRKPINRRTNTCMCVTCMSAIFVNECLMFVDDRFFSQIELWNHDSKSIALIKTSKSVITVDCFVFRSILTCPRMNHNITSLTRPYRGVQQMVCGRYLSTVILHNGSVNTSTCQARESGVR